MWRYIHTEELYHHGIPGMKWGIRRYQRKDGSLTPAGRKRAAKLKNEYTQLTGKKLRRNPDKKEDTKQTSGKKVSLRKTISEMSDTQLKERYNRLNTEKQVLQLEKERASNGQKFITTVAKDVLKPALIETGKRVTTDYLTKIGKEALGVDGKKDKLKEEHDTLKRDSETLNYKKQIIERQKWLDDYEKRKKK